MWGGNDNFVTPQKGKHMIIFLDLLIFLTIVAIVVTYFICFKDYTIMQLSKTFQTTCKKGFIFIYDRLNIAYLQSIKFFPFPSFEPFVEQVLALHICKIFKFLDYIEIQSDLWLIRFRIRGIIPEYLKNLNALKVLLVELLQDFLIEWFGANQYPIVYCVYINEGEVDFWIAKNAYGNKKIIVRMKSDEEHNLPNIGDIEDE